MTWLTVQAMRVLLRVGARLGLTDGDGMTELHFAAMADQPEVRLIYGLRLVPTRRMCIYQMLHIIRQLRTCFGISLTQVAVFRPDTRSC